MKIRQMTLDDLSEVWHLGEDFHAVLFALHLQNVER
jgi:hypothetical protein